MIPIAHVGHWLINLLYVAPLLIALAVLGYTTLKDRRAQQRGEGHERRPPTPPRPPAQPPASPPPAA